MVLWRYLGVDACEKPEELDFLQEAAINKSYPSGQKWMENITHRHEFQQGNQDFAKILPCHAGFVEKQHSEPEDNPQSQKEQSEWEEVSDKVRKGQDKKAQATR